MRRFQISVIPGRCSAVRLKRRATVFLSSLCRIDIYGHPPAGVGTECAAVDRIEIGILVCARSLIGAVVHADIICGVCRVCSKIYRRGIRCEANFYVIDIVIVHERIDQVFRRNFEAVDLGPAGGIIFLIDPVTSSARPNSRSFTFIVAVAVRTNSIFGTPNMLPK